LPIATVPDPYDRQVLGEAIDRYIAAREREGPNVKETNIVIAVARREAPGATARFDAPGVRTRLQNSASSTKATVLVSDAARPPGALDVDLLTECAWADDL
jgi:hypothetical protein